MYRPEDPFTTPMQLYNVASTEVIKGVTKKKYALEDTIFCSFKTFGGTEVKVNGEYALINTADIVTWYRPDITASSQLGIGNEVYEVIGKPENIDMRNQFLKFKIRGVKGGA